MLVFSGITREIAERALLRRFCSLDGAELVARQAARGDHSGIGFPYIRPGAEYVHAWRLGLDNPPMKRKTDGTIKPKHKYLTAAGQGN